MKKALLGALIISAVTAVQASAVTINFSSNPWEPDFYGQKTKTVGNTTVTAAPTDDYLSWDNNDGYGVQSGFFGDPQIDPGQRLDVSFSTLFSMTAFNVTNLGRDERGYYRLNGTGNWVRFNGTNNNGNLQVAFNPGTLVSSIQFGFDPNYGGSNDFSLKSLTGDFQTTPPPPTVPEPTSMVLVGTGLLGLVARARRKKNV